MEITSLNTAAQVLLDMYYQDYAPEDAFIDLNHVKFLMHSLYLEKLNAEYKQAKLMNKALEGFSFVTFDNEMLVSEEIDISKVGDDYVGQLKTPVFSFAFDSIGTGVQRVRNTTDTDCKVSELIRVSRDDAWVYKITPPTNKVFFYSQTTAKAVGCAAKASIVVLGACHPKKVEVQYLPGLDESGDMPMAMRFAKRISDEILQTLLIAKGQVIVDKSNDRNPNAVAATEMNPDSVKPNP